MRSPIASGLLGALVALLPPDLWAQDGAGRRVDFAREVWPILEKSCVRCHGARKDPSGRTRKPKGGLRLDGKHWILAGGENGPVVKPGDPARSPLWTRTVLDPDDDDFMPAKGDPLTEAQTDILRRWIEQGATFGDWRGAPGPAGTDEAASPAKAIALPSRVALAARLGRGLPPAAPDLIERARAHGALVSAEQPGSPLLRVEFFGSQDRVDDDTVRQLVPLRDHITHLNLSGTRVTDRGLALLARMPRLTWLDLHDTRITDRGVAALVGLKELRHLNLYGTPVTDRGLRALENLTSLEALFVWNTKVTGAGVERLRSALGKTRIVQRMELPEPVQGDTDRPRRRRR